MLIDGKSMRNAMPLILIDGKSMRDFTELVVVDGEEKRNVTAVMLSNDIFVRDLTALMLIDDKFCLETYIVLSMLMSFAFIVSIAGWRFEVCCAFFANLHVNDVAVNGLPAKQYIKRPKHNSCFSSKRAGVRAASS